MSSLLNVGAPGQASLFTVWWLPFHRRADGVLSLNPLPPSMERSYPVVGPLARSWARAYNVLPVVPFGGQVVKEI